MIEVFDYAPGRLTPRERYALLVLAEDARDSSRLCSKGVESNETVMRRFRVGRSERAAIIKALIEKGALERVKRGQKNQHAEFRIPPLAPRGTPQGPETPDPEDGSQHPGSPDADDSQRLGNPDPEADAQGPGNPDAERSQGPENPDADESSGSGFPRRLPLNKPSPSPTEKEGGVGETITEPTGDGTIFNIPDPVLSPKKPKSKTAKDDSEHPRFAEWYAAYPLRKERDAASKAFNKAVAKVGDVQILFDAAKRYTETDPYVRRGYIKNPATWLNKGCWKDEPDAQADQKRNERPASGPRSARPAAEFDELPDDRNGLLDAVFGAPDQ